MCLKVRSLLSNGKGRPKSPNDVRLSTLFWNNSWITRRKPHQLPDAARFLPQRKTRTKVRVSPHRNALHLKRPTAPHPWPEATPATPATQSTHKSRSSSRSHTKPASYSQSDP